MATRCYNVHTMLNDWILDLNCKPQIMTIQSIVWQRIATGLHKSVPICISEPLLEIPRIQYRHWQSVLVALRVPFWMCIPVIPRCTFATPFTLFHKCHHLINTTTRFASPRPTRRWHRPFSCPAPSTLPTLYTNYFASCINKLTVYYNVLFVYSILGILKK